MSSEYKFDTNIKLTETMSVSTDGKVLGAYSQSDLPNNAVICPGKLTINPDISGEWAVSKLEVISSYPVCGLDQKPCLEMQSYSSITKQNIDWLSGTQFQPVYDFYQTSPYYSPVNFAPSYITTGLHDEKVDYSMYGISTDLSTNKKGEVNLFCKGLVSLKLKKSGGSTTTLFSNKEAPNLGLGTYTITSTGVYTITESLDDLDCFGVVKPKFYPSNANPTFDKYVYGFAKGGSTNILTLQNALIVNVEDPDFSLTATKLFPTGTVSLSNGESFLVYISVTNTGDVDIKVDQVSKATGTTAGFTVSEGPASAPSLQNPLNSVDNDFNEVISPGSSGLIIVTVQGPATVPSSANVKINLHVAATEKTCGEPEAGKNFEGKTINIPDIPIIPEPELKSCEFVPSSKNNLYIDEKFSFDLFCYNESKTSPTKKKISCLGNGVTVNVANKNIADLATTPSQLSGPKTNVTVIGYDVGSTTVVASNTQISPQVQCSASITVPGYPNPDSCELQKLLPTTQCSMDTNLNEGFWFELICRKNGQVIPCPENSNGMTILVSNGIALFNTYVPNEYTDSAIIVLDNKKHGNGTLTVSKAGQFSCSAPVCVQVEPEDYNSCTLSPSSTEADIGEKNHFSISCSILGAQAPCPSVSWTSSGTKSNETNSGVDVVFGNQGTGTVLATVTSTSGTPSTFSCSATADIGVPPAQVTKSCVIEPEKLETYKGVRNTLNISCYNLSLPYPYTGGFVVTQIPCQGVTWDFIPKSKGITWNFLKQSNTGAQIRFNTVGKGNVEATVGSFHSYSCNNSVFVSPPPVNEEFPDACNVTPDSPINLGEEFDVAITCYNKTTGKVLPCVNVTWALNGNPGGTISGDDTGAKCKLLEDGTNQGDIVAFVNDKAAYQCNAVVGGKLPSAPCKISPSTWYIYPAAIDATNTFTVTCGEGKCNNNSAIWSSSYDGLISFPDPDDPTNLAKKTWKVAELPEEEKFNGKITVEINDDIVPGKTYSCSADFYMGEMMCIAYI